MQLWRLIALIGALAMSTTSAAGQGFVYTEARTSPKGYQFSFGFDCPKKVHSAEMHPAACTTGPSLRYPHLTLGERCSTWWNECKYRLQEKCLGFPEEFEEAPLGASLYAHGKAQVDNGEAARMVLYHFDFVEGTNELNTKGKDRLARIALMLPGNFFPIIIERTPQMPGLAEARRLTVVNELAHCSFPVPAERVMIGPAVARGLSGVEAEAVYDNLLLQTRTRGTALGTGISFGKDAPATTGVQPVSPP